MSVNRRPFDLGKLDFEGVRRARRKRLLVWSLGPIIALLLVTLWLVLPFIATAQARSASDRRAYGVAEGWLRLLVTNSVFEPYKRALNRALTASSQKHYVDAENYFHEAIAAAPEDKKCFVRQQSVLASEQAGDDAAGKKDFQNGVLYYTKALSDIAANPRCFEFYPALVKRIAEKLARLEQEAKEQLDPNADGPKPLQEQSGTTPSDQQMKTLNNLQQLSQIAKQEEAKKEVDLNDRTEKQW